MNPKCDLADFAYGFLTPKTRKSLIADFWTYTVRLLLLGSVGITTATGFTVEIQNTTASISTVAEALDGLSFGTGGKTFTLSSLSFGSQANAGPVTCTSSGCTSTGSSTDKWQYSNGVLEPQGYKPDGVVNKSVFTTCQSNCSSIANAQHNPFFIDPIFTFSGTLDLSKLGTITTDWGTGPNTITTQEPPISQVPEPSSVLLFVSGIVALFVLTGRKVLASRTSGAPALA